MVIHQNQFQAISDLPPKTALTQQLFYSICNMDNYGYTVCIYKCGEEIVAYRSFLLLNGSTTTLSVSSILRTLCPLLLMAKR